MNIEFKMKRLTKLFKIGILLTIISILCITGSNILVVNNAKGKIFISTKDIPYNKVGLLLGTGKILSNGRTNLYYINRIDAAVKLYKAGKISFILVSGDNGNKNYDEPSTIKEDLILKGVPENKIYLDYAGFRTLDSVVRSKKIFGQTSITIISQRFHNERAIYIAEKNDIKAVAFNAEDVNKRYGLKTILRERFARVKMIIDLTLGKNPKFLGEKIIIK